MSNKNKNRLSFEAQLSRHSHDVSRRHASSFTTGQLRPQWWDLAQPGDKYYMTPSMFARLQLVARAFLGEVDINLKVFFVPLQMLYTPFGQIFAQTDDVLSSIYKSIGSTDTFPRLNVQETVDGALNSNYYLGHKECVGKEHARLLDDLLLNPYSVLSSQQRADAEYTPPEGVTPIDAQMCFSPSITPWALAAYQAIYQKAFRNDEFEKFDIQSYNFDQYWSAQEPFLNDRLLKMRYVQRPSDYFTKTRVSPIASFINKLDGTPPGDAQIVAQSQGGAFDSLLAKVSSWLSGSQFQTNSNISLGFDDPISFGLNNSETLSASPSGFSIGAPSSCFDEQIPVSNIRAAFALDKFLRVYGRAGKTYDDQILAHFGVKIPHDVKHDITEIGSVHGKLQVEPVYSTATVGIDNSSALGQVGGQGQVTISSNSEIMFTAPVHGVVMCVAYAVTKPRYYGTYDKLHLLSSRIDFPIPEFDKLGAQPLYSFEMNPQALVVLQSSGEQPVTGLRFGWQNRWQHFKDKYDTCSFTYAPADAFGSYSEGAYVQENSFMPWILSRPAFSPSFVQDTPSCTPRAVDLWETPEALNSVMDVPYNGAWSNDYFAAPHLMMQTDPIITDFNMDVRKVSWMSETGETF